MFVKFYNKKLRDRNDRDGREGEVIGEDREKEREWSREPEGLGTDPSSSILAVCPWVSLLTSLCCGFPLCKIGLITLPTHKVVVRIK